MLCFTIQKGKITVELTVLFVHVLILFFHPGNRFAFVELHFPFQKLTNINSPTWKFQQNRENMVLNYFRICWLKIECVLFDREMSISIVINATVSILSGRGLVCSDGIAFKLHRYYGWLWHFEWCPSYLMWSFLCVSECCVGKMHKMFQLVAHQKQSVGRISP